MSKLSVLLIALVFALALVTVYRIDRVESIASIHIKADGEVEPIGAPISRMGNDVYNVTDDILIDSGTSGIMIERNNMTLDGGGHLLEGNLTGIGVYLSNRRNVTVTNLCVSAFNEGIAFWQSHNSSIIRCAVSDTVNEGIRVTSSSNNTLAENHVSACNGTGMAFGQYSNKNTLLGNNLTGNYGGIRITGGAENSTLVNNSVTFSQERGILLDYSSGNTLTGNVMSMNKYNFAVQTLSTSNMFNAVDETNLVEGKQVIYLVNQTGLTITPASHPQIGYLALANCTDIRVEDLTLEGNGQGILLGGTNNSQVVNCSLSGNRAAVELVYSWNNTVTENRAVDNLLSVNSYYSGNNSFFENTAHDYGGMWLLGSVNDTVTRNNIAPTDGTGIGLDFGLDCIVSENNVTGGEDGITVSSSNDTLVVANNVSGATLTGMALIGSYGNTLRNNRMLNNTYNFNVEGWDMTSFINDVDGTNTVDGKPVRYWINETNKTVPEDAGYVALVNCTLMTVQNLNLTRNGEGVLLVVTENSTVLGCDLSRNEHGVSIIEASGTTLFGNNIEANDYAGVRFDSSCYATSIAGNNITDNAMYGIDFYDATENTVYHNNFINNTSHVGLSGGNPVGSWDDGVEGNYWDDYAGADSDNDGIGDEPHVLDVANQDNHPLMGMAYSLNMSFLEPDAFVTLISNSSISNFDFAFLIANPEEGRWIFFNVTGEDSLGFCRISIPHVIMNGTYNVTVDNAEPLFINYSLADNATHRWIYFTYQHSTHGVMIVPELQSSTVFALLAVGTLAVAAFRRKRRTIRCDRYL